MSDARADTLLKSALEKIVYFEARSEQIQSDLTAARAELGELKRELTEAGVRELDFRRQVAELEVSVQRTHREREELGRMNDALKAERAVLLEKLIESSRIHAVGTDIEPTFDLASFIAELRGEVLAARAPGASAAGMLLAAAAKPESKPRPAPSTGTQVYAPDGNVSEVAERLLREGRLEVSDAQMEALVPRHAGRTEETLFGFSVRELSAPDATARIRAAERLRALGQRAAAPVLAAALHAETEPEVTVVLLATFAALAHKEGAPVVLPLLESRSPEVRMAALKALLALDPSQAGPRLAAAAEDKDPAVRRRASLLALGLDAEQAQRVEHTGTHDENPDVRRLSALTLGAGGGERARGQLLEALRDPDTRVRRAAAMSLSRILGEDVSYVVNLEDAPRRREIRRLATLPVRTSEGQNLSDSIARATRFTSVQRPLERVSAAPSPVRYYEEESCELEVAHEQHAHAGALAVGPTTPAGETIDSEALCQQLMVEMRAAIRGRSLSDLSLTTRVPPARVEDACALLVARGQVVRRGLKYFVA